MFSGRVKYIISQVDFFLKSTVQGALSIIFLL
jgi:hypothetical protein